jgi:hypothetical protein
MPLFLLLLWLFWPSTGRPRSSEPAAMAQMKPRLLMVAGVSLRAGRTVDLQVSVERPTRSGPLRIELRNLPPGVTAAPVDLAAGAGLARVGVKLETQRDCGVIDARFSICLLEGEGEELHELRNVPLLVTTSRDPLIKEVQPTPIELIPGTPQLIRILVDGQGNTDPWAVRVEDLPPGVVQTKKTLVSRKKPQGVAIELLASASASNIEGKIVSIVLLGDGHPCDRLPVSLSVLKRKREVAIDVILPEETRLQPGKKTTLAVRLTRAEYDGEVMLRLDRAPPGVSAAEVTVPAGRNAGLLTLEAGADAGGPLALDQIRVIALVDGKQVGASTALLRLEKAGRPPEITTIATPRMVKIPTADGLILVGTFYPSAEKSKGPCVLLLHELSATASRSNPAWVKLARALQKEGCAVLTLDFRGFGESREEMVPPGFWTSCPPNQNLAKTLRGGLPLRRLDSRNWLGYTKYLPWLVQDIVAARLWLDLEHDRREVNTHNLFLVAAGDGAQLATIWLATEGRRYQVLDLPFFGKPIPQGKDVLGGVWFDLTDHRIGPLKWSKMVFDDLKADQTLPPLRLVYDKGATDSVKAAAALTRALTPTGGVSSILSKPVAVLEKKGGISATVVESVTEMIRAAKLKPWTPQNVTRSGYQWQLPKNRFLQAKLPGSQMPALVPLDAWGFKSLPAR